MEVVGGALIVDSSVRTNVTSTYPQDKNTVLKMSYYAKIDLIVLLVEVIQPKIHKLRINNETSFRTTQLKNPKCM